MKQGTSFLMPVSIGMDISLISSIEFLFVQGDAQRKVIYPSDEATVNEQEERRIDIVWTEEQTWLFDPKCKIKMDTKIHLKDSPYNPDTPIVRFDLHETLFEKSEVEV